MSLPYVIATVWVDCGSVVRPTLTNSDNSALNSKLHKAQKQGKSMKVNNACRGCRRRIRGHSLYERYEKAGRAKGKAIRARITYKTQEKLIMAMLTEDLE